MITPYAPMGVLTHKIAIYGWIYTKPEFEHVFGLGRITDDYSLGKIELLQIQEWLRERYPVLSDPTDPDLKHQVSVTYVLQSSGPEWTIAVSLFGEIPGDDDLYKEDGYAISELTSMHAQYMAHKEDYAGLGEPRLHFLLNEV